jgi:hypothetical protein
VYSDFNKENKKNIKGRIEPLVLIISHLSKEYSWSFWHGRQMEKDKRVNLQPN